MPSCAKVDQRCSWHHPGLEYEPCPSEASLSDDQQVQNYYTTVENTESSDSSSSSSSSMDELSIDYRGLDTTNDCFASEENDEVQNSLSKTSQAARTEKHDNENSNNKLLTAFLLMILIGSGNKIFQKLQAIPMYNYPNFLNLFALTMYVPLSFAYIIPVSKFGWFDDAITPHQVALPKKPFAIMGCLDCLAGLMQTFASVYLPGPLLVLLPQAAIPISMGLSRQILRERYGMFQYVGAVVVIAGILLVLEPLITNRHVPDYLCLPLDVERDCTVCEAEDSEEGCLSHRFDAQREGMGILFDFGSYASSLVDPDAHHKGDSTTEGEGTPLCEWVTSNAASSNSTNNQSVLIWSLVMILSCIPMTLSSIYKEIALGDETNLDPIYMNGWIALFQFFFSMILAVPAGMASSPPVLPQDFIGNIYNGLKCYLGTGSIETGCHPDDMCAAHAALFVNTYLVLNIFYNLLMMYILKYGSSNLLYLALTVMVPVGNLAFTLPLMPNATTLHLSDVLGLVVIMLGLVFYRFGGSFLNLCGVMKKTEEVVARHSVSDENGIDSLRGSLLPLNEECRSMEI